MRDGFLKSGKWLFPASGKTQLFRIAKLYQRGWGATTSISANLVRLRAVVGCEYKMRDGALRRISWEGPCLSGRQPPRAKRERMSENVLREA